MSSGPSGKRTRALANVTVFSLRVIGMATMMKRSLDGGCIKRRVIFVERPDQKVRIHRFCDRRDSVISENKVIARRNPDLVQDGVSTSLASQMMAIGGRQTGVSLSVMRVLSTGYGQGQAQFQVASISSLPGILF